MIQILRHRVSAFNKQKENPMSFTLPSPVASYLAAEKAKDADMLAESFANDATVDDEGHIHRGREAIRSWKREADTRYQYVMEPLEASVGDKVVKIRARLTGNFPGSPVELDHTFTFKDDKITSLEINP
jgi:hypothetical protein